MQTEITLMLAFAIVVGFDIGVVLWYWMERWMER